MKRVSCAFGLLTLAAGMIALGSAFADDKKDPTIKQIMTKAHKGADSLIQKIGKGLKVDEPDWANIETMSKELLSLGTSLGKNEPPKGSKESWEKLTSQYVKNAEALTQAVEAKDKNKASAAQKKLTGMCATCHKSHKQ